VKIGAVALAGTDHAPISIAMRFPSGTVQQVSDNAGPEVFLQWKGTDACLDLYCTCGEQFHFDGYFADELTCGNCGQTWELPHMLQPEAVEPSRGFKIVFDGREVIGDGEFGIPWPRPEFSGARAGEIIEVHDEIAGCASRSAYCDFLAAVPNGDGTMTLKVRNRGDSPR
jgi:hypothetical protein